MRIIFICCFAVLLTVNARAQKEGQAAIDSSLKVLAAQKEDTNKVRSLYRVSGTYADINPDEGIKYGQRALALATKLNWKKGIANACNSIGTNFLNKPDYPKALEYYLTALKIDEEIGNARGVANLEANIGAVYRSQKNYPKALDYDLKSLNYYKAVGDKSNAAGLISNIGFIYDEQGNYINALEYYLKALDLDEETDNTEGVAGISCNIGTIYYVQNDFAHELFYYFKALAIFEKAGNVIGVAGVTTNIGGSYLALATDTMLKVWTKEKFLTIGLPDSVIPKDKRDCMNKAIHYLETALKMEKDIKALNNMQETYQFLAKAYKAHGEYQKALDAYQNFTSIKDSIFSDENKRKTMEQGMKYEYEKKEAVAKVESEKQLQKQKLIRNGFVLGFIIVLLFAGVFFNQRNKISKAKKHSDELVVQKDMLMREIHHRVKNNLQVIGALLELQSNSLSDGSAKEAIAESTLRVRSISLIHHQLYQDSHVAEIEVSKFVSDLFDQVASIFHHGALLVKLNNEVKTHYFDIDTIVPFGLILNELFTNSFKYAFINQQTGSISISIEEKSAHSFVMHYTDSGPGLPGNIVAEKAGSLGMRMIKRLSSQLGGKLVYDQIAKVFNIHFMDELGRKEVD